MVDLPSSRYGRSRVHRRSAPAMDPRTGVLLCGSQQPGIPCTLSTHGTRSSRGSGALAETRWKLGKSREFSEGRRSIYCDRVRDTGVGKPLVKLTPSLRISL